MLGHLALVLWTLVAELLIATGILLLLCEWRAKKRLGTLGSIRCLLWGICLFCVPLVFSLALWLLG